MVSLRYKLSIHFQLIGWPFFYREQQTLMEKIEENCYGNQTYLNLATLGLGKGVAEAIASGL